MSKSRKNNGKNNNIVPRSQHATAGSNMVWTKEAVSEADFMVFRDAATNKIVNVVAPNGLQVGLFDPDFTGNLTATGHITGSGEIYAHHNMTAKLGFTGSLQKLYDGTDYLLGGSNVTVTNNSNGSITIAANAAATTGEVLTAGSGLDMAGTFDGSTARTINVDIDSESSVTAASGDFVLIHDVTDGTIKKTTVGSIQGAGAAIDIAGLSNSLNETQLAIGDLFAVADVDAANETKKITVQDFSQFLASETNGGISESSGKLAISLSELSAAAVDVSADSIAILDATDSSTKLESIPDLVSGMAGTVTSTAIAASSGVLSVDITNQTSIASLAAGDEVLVYDVDTSALKKATVSDFSIGSAPVDAQYVVLSSDSTLTNESVLTAGDGLDLSSSTFSLDLKSSGGLKIDSTELSIEPADFAGTGLEDDGSDNLRISSAAAGAGLSGGGGSALSVDYGSTSGKAVEGNTSFALTAGYGMSGGISSTAIGGGISLNLDVEPEEFAGTGLSTSSNNLNVYLSAGAGTEITTGSEGNLVITSTSTSTSLATEYHFSSSAPGMLSATGSLSLAGNLGFNHKTSDVGLDVFTFISGSKSSRGTSERGTTAFGGDVVISGTLYGGSPLNVGTEAIFPKGISGSLTQLSDGSSYLVAGNNITIATGSNGSITITSSGGGEGGGSGVIGEAEDGSYEDGLFTDFTTNTPVGTAVDRFNEILSALSPSPAPNLDNISETTTDGITAFLSFGAANNQTSQSPAYPSVLASAGIGSAVDVNSSYAFSTSGNNIRLGIYNGTQDITGILNDDVSSNSQGGGFINFPENSFSDGDSGTLELEVNGAVLKSINLSSVTGTGGSGLGTANELNGNSSGFTNLSTATTGTFSNGNSFSTFKHRTGKYIVKAADQRNGWNYLKVNHVKSGATSTTNYVEWVNDPNSDALASAGNSLTFIGSGSIHLSGVEYFKSGSLIYKNRVSNAYKYIYDNTDITFSASNSATLASGQAFNFVAQSKPTIDTDASETHAKVLHLTASSDFDADFFINGQLTVGSNVTHPIKSNLANSGQATVNQILMYDLSNTSTALSETFRQENYRIISSSYDTQASVVNSNNVWDSQKYMTSSNGGHSNGLQFYNSSLLSPTNTLNSGNFSVFSNGPSQNPDYSGVSETRTFIRWFKNETGSTQYDLSLAINGSGTIVQEGTSLNSSRLSVLVKLPGSTGWMDAAREFVLDSFGDTAGAYVDNDILNFDSSLNATNYLNFGNVGIADDNYIVLKIIADESWTGNISQITVDFGAGTGTLTAIPNLDDINCIPDGVDANISFGSSKTISGYSNPTAAAGFTAANLNDIYETASNNNNLRAAVFNGTSTITGNLNDDVSSPGNDYVAKAFSDANSGSLKLEVNGAVIHELAITGAYNSVGATSLNSDSSGFQNISPWKPGLFDNGVPRYSEVQRTAQYAIAPASQRPGWNYARVLHSVGGSDRTTNYVEWVNDSESTVLSSSSGLSIFGDNTHSYLSGVKYFNSPSGSIVTAVSHIYKNVYSDSDSAISFNSLNNCSANKIIQAGIGLSSTKTTNAATDSLQTLNTNTNSQNEVLHVTGTINFSRSKSLPGIRTTSYPCGGAMVFDHPLKANHTTAVQSTSNLLVWTPSDTSNLNTNEYFTGETYRLVSGSYTTQSDASSGPKNWNSQRSMNDQESYPEHATGLLVYDTYLCPPKDGGSSGDFRAHSEGGSIESPVGNVNYNTGVLTNAIRDHYRKFQNNTTNDLPAINITLYGDANLVASSGAANTGVLGSNKNIFVDVSIPGKTGFLDLAKPTAGSGNVSTGDGCLSGDIDQSIDGNGAINRCTFNGVTVDGTVSGAEYIIIRVTASKDWTGYLERIAVSWS